MISGRLAFVYLMINWRTELLISNVWRNDLKLFNSLLMLQHCSANIIYCLLKVHAADLENYLEFKEIKSTSTLKI